MRLPSDDILTTSWILGSLRFCSKRTELQILACRNEWSQGLPSSNYGAKQLEQAETAGGLAHLIWQPFFKAPVLYSVFAIAANAEQHPLQQANAWLKLGTGGKHYQQTGQKGSRML